MSLLLEAMLQLSKLAWFYAVSLMVLKDRCFGPKVEAFARINETQSFSHDNKLVHSEPFQQLKCICRVTLFLYSSFKLLGK